MRFNFGEFNTTVHIGREIPAIHRIAFDLGIKSSFKPLIIADENTASIAEIICGGGDYPCCILKSGEENKNWQTVETILATAVKAGLGRDGVFIAVGGGVIGDLAGFAASIYMRGCRFVYVSTTLLGMIDASVGGKTGFNIFCSKNLAGAFYPAEIVYIPVNTLSSLSEKEWKSGMAELIKTAILAGDDFLDELIMSAANQKKDLPDKKESNHREKKGLQTKPSVSSVLKNSSIINLIERAVTYKGSIVSEDFREAQGGKRKLLNLGHTFAHALESAAGLGSVSHGEAVAWGIVRACKLGRELEITPKERAEKIIGLIEAFGYESGAPHPLADNTDMLINAMKSDKKKNKGKLIFIIPDDSGACSYPVESEVHFKLLKNILNGSIL